MGEAAYVEAYPRIDLVREGATFAAGRTVARLVIGAREVGELLVLSDSGERLLVGYSLYDGHSAQDGIAHLPVVSVPVGIHNNRRYFHCTDCNRRAALMVFNNAWSCRLCHGLAHRSQLIPREAAYWEDYLQLRERIGEGRPPGMWHRRYDRLRARLDLLEQRLRQGERVANSEHSKVVSSRWMTPAEAQWLSHSQFDIVSGAIVERQPSQAASEQAAVPTGIPPVAAPAIRAFLSTDSTDFDDDMLGD